jgi:hypothetical protein
LKQKLIRRVLIRDTIGVYAGALAVYFHNWYRETYETKDKFDVLHITDKIVPGHYINFPNMDSATHTLVTIASHAKNQLQNIAYKNDIKKKFKEINGDFR